MAYILTEYIGLNGQKVAAIQETVSGRFYQLQGLALADGNVLGGEDLGSGYGLYVINVAKQEVRGTMAEGATISTEPPVYVGGYAMTSRTSPTPLTDGEFEGLGMTADRALITAPYTNHENLVSAVASNTDGVSTEVIPAGASGVRTYLTWVHLVNTSATPITVQMKDGTTVMDTLYLAATSGVNVTYPTPLRGTAATAWNFDPSGAATTVTCSAGGYQSKV